MSTGNVTVRLNLNSAGYSAGIAAAQKQMQALGRASSAAGHGTVNSMQAASAAIRVLEGGMTGNIRAAERFISTIPGVGKALQAAFPLVGGIALAGVFIKIGMEAAKAIQTVQKAQQNIDNSFRSLNLSGQMANDTLRVTNDRLENEIAKLQGKPQNNLAIAIDEARVAADKMAESLDRDNSKIKELLSQNAVPWWAGFLGKAGTSVVSETINAQNQHLADLANQANILQHQGDTTGADRVRAQIDSTRQQYIQANNADMAARRANQNLPGGLNQGANLSVEYGQQASLYNQIDQEGELKRNVTDQAEKQRLDDLKAQQEAAKRAAEAIKQAQELIVQQWHKNLDEQKADNDMTLAQEGRFWVQRMEQSRKGSLSYIAALDEANKVIARERSQNMRGNAEFDTLSSNIGIDRFDLSRSDNGDMQKSGQGAVEYLRNLNEGIQLQHANADAIAEASLRMAEMTGQMGKLDVAQAMAALHAKEYADATSALSIALENAQSLPAGFERDQRIAGLQNQGTQMAGQRSIQQMQDQQGIAGMQLGPGITQALGRMEQDWTNMTASIVQVMTRGIDSLNDDIVKAMTGQGKKGDFGRTFMQAGQGLLKTGVQAAEGWGLRALHLGGAVKADGSQANPFYVVMAGSSSGSAVGAAVGAAGSSGLGGLIGKIAPFVVPFIGGHASGGDIMAGRPSMVGERGPEMFVPNVAGRIIPNQDLTGSSGSSHFYNVDARGATDPAAIHAAVARALPHAVAASTQTQHQMRMRTPHAR